MNADLAIGIGALGFLIGPIVILFLEANEASKRRNGEPEKQTIIGGTTYWTDDMDSRTRSHILANNTNERN